MKRTDIFYQRHIGNNSQDMEEILDFLGIQNMEALIKKTIPEPIRCTDNLILETPMSEHSYLEHISELGKQNKLYKSYIGMGYHPTILPSVIRRNILENPGWYTAYTPYQAEISQGRLEALLNFQTMVIELTGMEIANASLLDEATAAAEAMLLLYNTRTRIQKKNNAHIFLVSKNIFPQTVSVLQTRAKALNIKIAFFDDVEKISFNESIFGVFLQYPSFDGRILDLENRIKTAKENDIRTVVASDVLALAILEAPGFWGAEIVVGTTQRFGIPMGYGGPHAAYFATKEMYKRNIPGRIIGKTKDQQGNSALRMALQTREQHIKREKATSNICTSQVLLAVMAGMYGVYHGAEGLKFIATKIHFSAVTLKKALEKMGIKISATFFFDTLLIENLDVETCKIIAEKRKINFGYFLKNKITISINETTNLEDLNAILLVFSEYLQKPYKPIKSLAEELQIPENLKRKTNFMTHFIFNSYHSETKMMRYIKKLERKDFSLNHTMIPLGSCTMKLNAATQMFPLTDPKWSNLHPFVPISQAKGYHIVFEKLAKYLNEITGFAATSFQPNSGAQGEYAGLLVIKSYHSASGNSQRNICLIPASAHGTNPASAVMAGMKVVVVKTDKKGNIDFQDLKEKAFFYKENLAALMITYPSTHGVFEEKILKITHFIHKHGGQVYMDGANMNAQVGFTNPAKIGADVCHLNLHKTFAIPHGGGGPGVGAISVAAHLKSFLPSHPFLDNKENSNTVSAAPWGSALILLISYGYIKMLGSEGLKKSTQNAILNANYIRKSLEKDYEILYTAENGSCAHELIIDFRPFKNRNIQVVDIAKRLMDYGYHAPTVSFPVAGTMMIEPTESEDKKELDTFIKALKLIKKEILEKENHTENSILKNAPHTQEMLTNDNWHFSYSRKKAAYPMENLKNNKLFPSVGRVDEAFGDRNLMCSCEPLENYE